MRIYSAAAIEAMANGQAIVSGAVDIACTPPFRVWGGYGDITLGGAVFKGIGDRGLVTVSAAALGDSEQNVTLSLSGVDPDVIALTDLTTVQRAPVAIWRLIFDGSGRSLLDAQVYTRGRLDTLPIKETVGGLSTLEGNVETAARGLGRASQRMRTDADQRLVSATDGGFRIVSYAGVKQLYWGGKPPSSGSALGGGGSGGGLGDNLNVRPV